jgi:hypothetical protein
MAFHKYAPYRSRNTEKKMICSPNKMPLTIHSVTPKRTQFVAYGKAVSSRAFQEYPQIQAETQRKLICSPNKMPLTIHSVTTKPTQFVAHEKAVSSKAFQEYAPYRNRNPE